MKKIFLVLTILLMAVSYSSAQSYSFLGENGNENSATDGFFSKTYSEYREENLEWGTMPLLPRTHGYAYDYDADAEQVPVGAGLLVLGLFGAGYALKKRKDA